MGRAFFEIAGKAIPSSLFSLFDTVTSISAPGRKGCGVVLDLAHIILMRKYVSGNFDVVEFSIGIIHGSLEEECRNSIFGYFISLALEPLLETIAGPYLVMRKNFRHVQYIYGVT